jgi:hypothetical protein
MDLDENVLTEGIATLAKSGNQLDPGNKVRVVDPEQHLSELLHPDPAPDVRTVPKNMRIRIRNTVAKCLHNIKPKCMYIEKKMSCREF